MRVSWLDVSFGRYLRISRPKFWLYLLGPYFLGAVLSIRDVRQLSLWQFWALFAWFTLPANLLLYGVNDIADYDTDRHNPRKVRGETLVLPHERKALASTVAGLALLAVPALLMSPPQVALAFAGFLCLSLGYSLPPLRFKTRPGMDSLSNVLYLTPLLVSWGYFATRQPPLPLVTAGALWCAAMHAYSAIPDIESDSRAGLQTIATLLRRDGTLLFCVACYAAAALIVGGYDWAGGLLLAAYPLVMSAQLLWARERVGDWYRLFPLLNGIVGLCLTLRYLLPLAAGTAQ